MTTSASGTSNSLTPDLPDLKVRPKLRASTHASEELSLPTLAAQRRCIHGGEVTQTLLRESSAFPAWPSVVPCAPGASPAGGASSPPDHKDDRICKPGRSRNLWCARRRRACSNRQHGRVNPCSASHPFPTL